jgi:hypothetical protein
MDTSTQVTQGQSTWQPSERTPDGLPVCQAAGNTTDGLYRVGRGVLAPIPKYTPIATPSEEARRMVRDRRVSKFPVSLVGLTVDEKGRPKKYRHIERSGVRFGQTGIRHCCEILLRPSDASRQASSRARRHRSELRFLLSASPLLRPEKGFRRFGPSDRQPANDPIAVQIGVRRGGATTLLTSGFDDCERLPFCLAER